MRQGFYLASVRAEHDNFPNCLMKSISNGSILINRNYSSIYLAPQTYCPGENALVYAVRFS